MQDPNARFLSFFMGDPIANAVVHEWRVGSKVNALLCVLVYAAACADILVSAASGLFSAL